MTQAPQATMAHGTQIAGYRILAHIGKGAASELYAVQDPKTKQVWALKHVAKTTDRDHRFLEQVMTEYQVGAKLDHPNVRFVHRIIKHRKGFRLSAVTLIMELIDAMTLDQREITDHAHAVRIFQQIAQGLAHMHARGFVHADIKPNNILVTDQDVVKIIDLGQACASGTVKKRIQGTPGYMAPEQAHRQKITPQTDIYNLGATMYWVLLGEVIPTAMPPKEETDALFTGARDVSMVRPPTPPHERDPSIHPLLSKQIMHCVKILPEERPESMARVTHRLELIGDLLENPGKPAPPVVGDEDTVFG